MLAIPLIPFGGKAWHRWMAGQLALFEPIRPRLAPSARHTAEVNRERSEKGQPMEISERLQAAIDAVDDLTYAEWIALKKAKDIACKPGLDAIRRCVEKEAVKRISRATSTTSLKSIKAWLAGFDED